MTARAVIDDHLLLANIGVNDHPTIDAALSVIAAHILDGTIHFTEASIDHANIQNIGANSHAAIDTHIADGTIHFTEGSIVHGNIMGLAADDHLQYLLLAGRAGGQSAFGSTLVNEHLVLAANPVAGVNTGRIQMNSGVEFNSISASLAPYAFNYAATESYSTAFVGGGLNMSGNITHTHSTFIYESFRGSPTITSNVNPGFAAYTVLQALPALIAGPGAGNRPLNPLIVNAAPRLNNPFSGVRTSATMAGMSNTPTINPSVSGAVMNVTNITGYQFSPAWNTVLGSTANFGTMRGLWAKNPVQQLFGGSAGLEIGAAYYAVDVQNITLSNGFGTMPMAAVRSAITSGTNRYFLLNSSSAESEFGTGDIHLDDGTWVKFGNGQLDCDMIIGWAANQAAFAFSTFFNMGNNPLYFQPNATDTWVFKPAIGGANPVGMGFNVSTIAFGSPDPNPLTQNWFVRYEGPSGRLVRSAGVYSDVWWTAGGSIDINGLAVTEINSFRIDPNTTILSGGTVQDQSGLHIAGMGFPGSGAATRIQSLRVTGRSRLDGAINLGSYAPAQITANQNNYQLGISNSQRAMNLLNSDAAYNITGIDSTAGSNTYAQPGDMFCIYNNGAFALTLTNQDALSLAANRIITSTGAGYVIGPNECVWLWYDDTGVARWRMLDGTGA